MLIYIKYEQLFVIILTISTHVLNVSSFIIYLWWLTSQEQKVQLSYKITLDLN